MLNNIVNSQEEDRVHIFPKTVEVDSYFSWNRVWVEKTDFEVYLYLQTPPQNKYHSSEFINKYAIFKFLN